MQQDPMPPFPLLFRDAMSAYATGVYLITTDGDGGRCGMTMTSVMPVTDSPPTMMLCVNLHTRILPLLSRHRALCLNILAAGQQSAAEDFAGLTGLAPEERFARHRWTQGGLDAQWQLEGALAHCHGRITAEQDIGTHRVFTVGLHAIDVPAADEDALAYFRRRFTTVPAGPADAA